jgi:hypothetical protein
METVHVAENLTEYGNCASCHPTGVAGEADQLRNMNPELYGQLDFNTAVNFTFDPSELELVPAK